MENEYIYLNYYQVLALLIEIKKLKENPYFKDGICEAFAEEVLNRTTEIALTQTNGVFSKIIEKIYPNFYKYKVFYSKFNYLTRLTKLDVLDEEVMKSYIPIIKEIEEETYREIESKNPEIFERTRK